MVIGFYIAALITILPFQIKAKPKQLSETAEVGDVVYFGRFEQDLYTKNGKEKIEWQVLDKKGNKALLVSKYLLDVRPYNKKEKAITWKKCTLRKWMNKEFFNTAFSEEEKDKADGYNP